MTVFEADQQLSPATVEHIFNCKAIGPILPNSMEERVFEILSNLETLLLEDNASGLEVLYFLEPAVLTLIE